MHNFGCPTTSKDKQMADFYDSSAELVPKLVSELAGNYFIPDYQRGYRWTRKQVRQLIEDISEAGSNIYYLQPVVMCKHKGEDGYDYDIVDGQQRLTTILLIYRALHSIYEKMKSGEYSILNEEDVSIHYSIAYETRTGSEEFLKEIEKAKIDDARVFADYLYMYHAYDEALSWLNSHKGHIKPIADAFRQKVKVIWYEIKDDTSPREVFQRLNIGKIKLTNSELVKALFLSQSSSKISEAEKDHIVEQWDGIERELHNQKFWSFLTNHRYEDYPTRIDLLFDIIAKKQDGEKDDMFTFLYFDNIMKDVDVDRLKEWKEIYLDFLRLRDWFTDQELYHKVGYLVAAEGGNILSELLEYIHSESMTNSQFLRELNRRIKASVAFDTVRIEDLTYKKNYYDIEKLLTLFNVISTMELKEDSIRYPFDSHKTIGGGWSLEHIHAQQSETLTTAEQWKSWTHLHLSSLKRFRDLMVVRNATKEQLEEIDSLVARMAKFDSNPYQTEFVAINQKYASIVVYDRDKGIEYKDYLSNLALLGKDDNSMLNNSTFDVKREIITTQLIPKSFIPICTQRVFLKTYTPAEKNQYFFWGEDDRKSYISAISTVLKPYLRTLPEQVFFLLKDVQGMKAVKDAAMAKAAESMKANGKKYDLEGLLKQNDDLDPLAYYERLLEDNKDDKEKVVAKMKDILQLSAE